MDNSYLCLYLLGIISLFPCLVPLPPSTKRCDRFRCNGRMITCYIS
uniref:Uncharacterized protein n=1 Tax=Populus trichocarpa TaxID=3694 RepID=A9PF04_POPTR|nr:unknown [Populus trichocarpa]